MSDTSTSAGVKSTVIHTSDNIFESSKRDKSQYLVDKVKDKRRTKNNNLEFDGLPHTIADYLESISRLELTTGTLLNSVNLH